MIISLMQRKRWRGWRNTMENNKDLDEMLLQDMFKRIRGAEVSNIKTQKRDDKGMVRIITEYVSKTVEKEMHGNEN